MSEENVNGKPRASREETTAKYKAFVAAWNASDSVTEVAQKTSLTVAQCNAMGTACRKNGVNLKKMSRKGTRVDWKSLQEAPA